MSIENGPGYNEFQIEALELLSRVGETEAAYSDAMKILSDLEKPEHREEVVEAIGKAGHEIANSDLENAYLLQGDANELDNKYGAKIFPLTIIIPIEKWSTEYIIDPETGKKVHPEEMKNLNPKSKNYSIIKRLIEQGYEIKKGGGLVEKLIESDNPNQYGGVLEIRNEEENFMRICMGYIDFTPHLPLNLMKSMKNGKKILAQSNRQRCNFTLSSH